MPCKVIAGVVDRGTEECLSVHKVGGWKGKKVGWESKQDHVWEALNAVSEDRGSRLEAK